MSHIHEDTLLQAANFTVLGLVLVGLEKLTWGNNT